MSAQSTSVTRAGNTIKVRSSGGGEFDCYLAASKSSEAVPAIVLASAVHGVDADICAIADEFAASGYLAAAPDLFWRTIPGPLSHDDGRAQERSQPRLERIKENERDMADTAREILGKAEARGAEVVLPVDAVVAEALKPGLPTATVAIDKVPADRMILDVGPATAADLAARLATCKTLVWNGPVGAFETPPFDAGTVAVARTAAKLSVSFWMTCSFVSVACSPRAFSSISLFNASFEGALLATCSRSWLPASP